MSYRPTHQWCPDCSAMLPTHLTTCPRCQADLTQPGGAIGNRDILRLTGMILGILLIPLVLIIGVGLLCTLAFS